MKLEFWSEEHREGDFHYHLCAGKYGTKRVFSRILDRLPELLPEGFHIAHYRGGTDIGVVNDRGQQHMHMRWARRSISAHSFHLAFLRPQFKVEFERIVRVCFPNAEVVFGEEGGEE